MKIHPAFLLALAGIAWSILPAHAQEAGPTVLEKGLFSYQAPMGWTVQDSPISKYKVSMGKPAKGFAPNINIVLESHPGALATYVAATMATLKASPLLKDVAIGDQQPFTTSADLDGVRVVVTDTLGKLHLQQIFYIFDVGSNNKLVVTASCLIDDGTKEVPLFDASLKTFSLE